MMGKEKVLVNVSLPSVDIPVYVNDSDNLTEIQEELSDKLYSDMNWNRIINKIKDSPSVLYYDVSSEDITVCD